MIEHTYIHIPFCYGKCKYCSFVSGFDIKLKNVYLQALNRQIEAEYGGEVQKTLYFGGGTPSLLDVYDISNLIKKFNLAQNAEITLEVNPESVVKNKFEKLLNAGINRISLGVQSFDDKILNIIGRNHNANAVYNALKTLKTCGFNNISVDLIYGLPSQTIDILKNDLQQIISANIQHISLYGLKIEENSYFYKHKPQNFPSDDTQADMFLYICDFLKNNGFTHYEISNFAKPGFESKHNNSYWKNKEYYGFGLSASGYIKNNRYSNCSDFNKYIQSPLLKDEECFLSPAETLENEIFLSLRLKNGVNIPQINKKYNIDFLQKYENIIKKYSELNLLKVTENNCFLTEKGILLSNNIMCEFIE